MGSPELSSLREDLLRAGFGRFNGTFASGVQANNKLQLGHNDLEANRTLRCRASRALTNLIVEHDLRPDLILPVPTGADGYGNDIANALSIPCVRLAKDAERQPHFRGQTEEAVQAHGRVVIVEDVSNMLTSVMRVIDLPGVQERTVGVVSLFDRGDPAARPVLSLPVYSLFTEHISAQLPEDSQYWHYADVV